MLEMELKLVAEIKERTDQKIKNAKESPVSEQLLAVSDVSHDPVAQLVTELSQSFNMDKTAAARKNSQTTIAALPLSQTKIENNGVNFMTPQLKKIDQGKKLTKDKIETNNDNIIDFKSRLRKVDGDKKNEDQTATSDENELETNKRESTASSDSGNLKLDEGGGDDKRKSTGSISSLKKLWETKEASETCANVQLSPKLALKNNCRNTEELISEVSPVDTSDDSIKGGRDKKNNAQIEDKPVIPTKPPVKAVKPVIASRPAGSAIYATPITPISGIKPPISAKPACLENKTPEDDVKVRNSKDWYQGWGKI